MWGQINRTQSITFPFKTVSCPSPVGSQHYRGAARCQVSSAAGRCTDTRHRVAAVLLLFAAPVLLFAAVCSCLVAVCCYCVVVCCCYAAVFCCCAPHWSCSSGQSQKWGRSMQVQCCCQRHMLSSLTTGHVVWTIFCDYTWQRQQFASATHHLLCSVHSNTELPCCHRS